MATFVTTLSLVAHAPVCGLKPRVSSPSVLACSDPAWPAHQLEVVSVSQHSAINATNLPPVASLYGVEGGHVVEVDGAVSVAPSTPPLHHSSTRSLTLAFQATYPLHNAHVLLYMPCKEIESRVAVSCVLNLHVAETEQRSRTRVNNVHRSFHFKLCCMLHHALCISVY